MNILELLDDVYACIWLAGKEGSLDIKHCEMNIVEGSQISVSAGGQCLFVGWSTPPCVWCVMLPGTWPSHIF